MDNTAYYVTSDRGRYSAALDLSAIRELVKAGIVEYSHSRNDRGLSFSHFYKVV